jgi:hypothetical protein
MRTTDGKRDLQKHRDVPQNSPSGIRTAVAGGTLPRQVQNLVGTDVVDSAVVAPRPAGTQKARADRCAAARSHATTVATSPCSSTVDGRACSPGTWRSPPCSWSSPRGRRRRGAVLSGRTEYSPQTRVSQPRAPSTRTGATPCEPQVCSRRHGARCARRRPSDGSRRAACRDGARLRAQIEGNACRRGRPGPCRRASTG